MQSIAFSSDSASAALTLPVAKPLPSAETATLAIDDIVFDPENPWGGDDADDDGLAGSIQALGVLQPPRVRRNEPLGKWMVIAGERRVRKAKRAGHQTILCVIDKLPVDPIRLHTERIAENVHRRNGHPIRLAKAFQALQQLAGYSLVQLAEAVQKDVSFVSRKVALLKFSEEIQEAIDDPQSFLEESTAIEIVKVRDEEAREALAQRAIRDKLTREQVIALVSAHRQRRHSNGSKTRPLRRLLCRLPGGATLTVTPPDGVPELTTEIIRDLVEFALQHLRKAHRQQVPAADLVNYFQQLKAKDRNAVTQPGAAVNGGDPSASFVSSTATAGN